MRSELLPLLALATIASAQPPLSPDKEAALGAQMAQEIRAQSSIVRDPAVRAYVSHLATKLAGPSLLLTLEVTDRDRGVTHEPTWLPGGYMFVSAQLIRTAHDESELAGMFAHALAHEINRDSLRLSAPGNPSGTIPLVWAGSEDAGLAMPIALAPRRRALELEADALAVKMTASVGYDPEALARYLTRLQPTDVERIDALRNAIEGLPAQSAAVVDSSDFQHIQERLGPTEEAHRYQFPRPR